MDGRSNDGKARAQLEAVVLVAAAEAAALESGHPGQEAMRAAQDRLSDAVAALATYLARSGEEGWVGHGVPRDRRGRAWGLTGRLPQRVPYSALRRHVEGRLGRTTIV